MTIRGHCHPRFEPVREALRANLASEGPNSGQAVAVVLAGELVVDLWGGVSRPSDRALWDERTLVWMASVGKAVAAICLHRLIDRGLTQLDTRVGHFWPRFANNGKRDITVGQVLSHAAGLPILEHLHPGDAADPQRVAQAIERQAPIWPPGSTAGYHSFTYGYLLDHIVRRLTGRTLDELLRAEICVPNGIEFFFSLAADESARCAEITEVSGNLLLAMMRDRETILGRSWRGTLLDCEYFNSTAFRTTCAPSVSGHGTVRSMARLFGALAIGGASRDAAVLSREGVQRLTRSCYLGNDAVLGIPVHLAMGVWRSSPSMTFSGEQAFGHPGVTGAVAFADPARRIGFAWAPNRISPVGIDNPCEERLRRTVLQCVDE